MAFIFFSYARADEDQDDLIRKFVFDLSEEVRALMGANERANEIAFFDQHDIRLGDDWDDNLKFALQNTLAMVCLFSPTYFGRPYCGKEMWVFDQRRRQCALERKLPSLPSVILPVLLHPCQTAIPKRVADMNLQLHEGDFPDIYKEEGLSYLLKSQRQAEYVSLLRKLARRTKEAISLDLSQSSSAISVKSVPNLFEPEETLTIQAQHTLPEEGPRAVRFVYVAASRLEASGANLRSKLDCYGAKSWEWNPFQVPITGRVGVMANAKAANMGFYSEELLFNEQLMGELERAKHSNTLVVLLVDSWSVKLPAYDARMRSYDSCGHWNCAAIVVFDNRPDTAEKSEELLATIRDVFDDNIDTRCPRFFRYPVESTDGLEKEIVDAIETLNEHVRRRGQVKRPLPKGRALDSL